MRHLDLREFEQSEPIRLSLGARRALRGCLPSLTIAPAPDSEHAYVLTPGATIGAVEIEDLSVSIQPKLGIGRVLFLASYTMGAFRLRDRDRFDFRDEDTRWSRRWSLGLRRLPSVRLHRGCSTVTERRRRLYTSSAGEFVWANRFGEGSAFLCRLRSVTMTSPRTF